MVRARIKINPILEKLMFSLLFLAMMNFQQKYFYFIFSCFALFCISHRKIYYCQDAFAYACISIAAAAFEAIHGKDIITVLRPLAFLIAFLLGYSLILYREEKQGKIQTKLVYIILILGLGPLVHFLINMGINAGTEVGVRNTIDVWSGEILNATGQAALAIPGIGFCCAMLVFPPKTYLRYVALVLITGILTYNLTLGGRTIIVVTAITFGVAVFLAYQSGETISKRIGVLLTVIAIIILIALAFSFDIGGIRSSLLNSTLYLRLGATSDGFLQSSRNERKLLYLKEMFSHLFGGNHMYEKYGYCHDLLLDAYDQYGIIVLVGLIAILITGIKNVLFVRRHDLVSREVSTLLICVYVSVLLEFCVEPIFAGMLWLFVGFCLLNGCISAICKLYVRNEYYESASCMD